MSKEKSTETSRSRFAYYGSEDVDQVGGVKTVAYGEMMRIQRTPNTGSGRSGEPGPEERLLDISEIAREIGMRYQHTFAIPPFPEGDFEAVSSIVGEVALTNTGAALILQGDATADLALECVRCLSRTVQTVFTEIDEAFDLVTTNTAYNQQEEVQVVDEDEPASVIKGNVLDLADLLRQNLLLATPLQPLCREDCPGIDLGGRTDVTLLVEGEKEEDLLDPAANPLRRLAELLEEKRRSEAGS